MSVTLSSVTNNQVFGTWFSRTNQIISIITANVVTTDNTSIGGFTSGNGTVNGYFGSNTLFARDELRGGNVTSSNTLSITSNTNFLYNTEKLFTITSNSVGSNIFSNVATISIKSIQNTTFTSNNILIDVANNAKLNANIFTVNSSVVVLDSLSVNNMLYVDTTSSEITANATSVTINANTYLNGTNTTVNSNTYLSNHLTVANSALFSNTLSVVGSANALSTLGVSGAANLLSTFGVTGAANLLSTVGVSGAANLLSTVGIAGAANLASTLGVNGAVTFANTLSVTGAANVLSTFGVTDAANLASTLGVNGAVTFANTLSVTGNTVFSNNLTVSGYANVGGAANVSGNLRVGGDLIVIGNLAFSIVTGGDLLPTINDTYFVGNTSNRWVMFGSSGNFSSNVTVSGTVISNNGIQLQDGSILNSKSTSTTGLTSQAVDTFSTTTFRSADYTVSIKDNNANGYQISKLLVIHNGTSAYVTEYGIMTTNASLGTFSSDISGGNVRLLLTPALSTSLTLKIARTSLVV